MNGVEPVSSGHSAETVTAGAQNSTMGHELTLHRLAARQHGLASRHQLIKIGYTRRQIDTRVANNQWRRVAPSVFDVAPASADPRRPLHAAVLASRGLASHRSAAFLLGLIDEPPSRPEIVVSGCVSPDGIDARVYRSRTIEPRDRTRVDGIGCTSATRTLLDLGAVVSTQVLAAAVSRSIVTRRSSVGKLLACVDGGPLHGRRGIALMRTVLEPYRADRAACESALEVLPADAIARSAVPAPRRQHQVRVEGKRFRLDTAWPEARVFVEVDGLADHAERRRFDSDRRRQNLLVAAGWLPLRYTWSDLTQRAFEVIAEIAAVLRARL